MSEKSTKELADILGKTHLSEFDQYCKDHKESMKAGKDMFFHLYKKYFERKRHDPACCLSESGYPGAIRL